MSAELVKAVCHQVAEDLKGHKVAAALAGVGPSTWADYVNFEKADTSIPLHRAIAIQKATKKDYFGHLFADEARPADGDPRVLGAGALQAIAEAEVSMARAYADGTITEAEKRELLAIAQRLVERAQDFAACIAGISTGQPPAAVRPLKVV